MSLAALLAARIEAEGPITVAQFMAEALLHPAHGYYATRDPFGAAGDFITAPEISQMFGELVGLALAQAWLAQGAPRPLRLAEAGPGRGTLMADILRVLARVPGAAGCEVHLIEASPVLRGLQRARLAGADVRWHDDLSTLPDAPLFLVANEFLDALPIRQFVRDGALWRERQVGLVEGRLGFGLAPPAEVPAAAHLAPLTAQGEMIELCPAATRFAADLGARIAARGGAALLIDYGGWASRGDTLQALRAHAPAPVLEAPGTADLTAHVDFERIAAAGAAAGAAVSPLVTQGEWLARLGIGARAETLAAAFAARGDSAGLARHRAALGRLTDPGEMGHLFKVLAFTPPGSPPCPGFERPDPALAAPTEGGLPCR